MSLVRLICRSYAIDVRCNKKLMPDKLLVSHRILSENAITSIAMYFEHIDLIYRKHGTELAHLLLLGVVRFARWIC